MIARLWSARATPQNWPAYEKHFIDTVVPELRTQKGYVASNLLQREDGDEIAITVLSFWRSLESLESFAGTDREAHVLEDGACAIAEAQATGPTVRFEARRRDDQTDDVREPIARTLEELLHAIAGLRWRHRCRPPRSGMLSPTGRAHPAHPWRSCLCRRSCSSVWLGSR